MCKTLAASALAVIVVGGALVGGHVYAVDALNGTYEMESRPHDSLTFTSDGHFVFSGGAGGTYTLDGDTLGAAIRYTPLRLGIPGRTLLVRIN
jgi:hypothetical protein